MPPSRRAAIYAGAVGDRDLVSAGVPLAALDELPAAARAAEARRLLDLRSVADDPVIRLAVTARLAWPESRPVLHAATRRATAGERAEAYRLYLAAGAASRDPAVFAAVLGSLTRLANEQDPVRTAALSALASVPPWLFRSSDADVVTALMSDAAQARDRSWQTDQAVRALCTRLIREGAAADRPALVEAGLSGVERLGGHLSRLDLSGLDRSLPRGAEHGVFAALRPRIAADARRGRYGVVLALASGLGRRAWHMPELQDFLARARGAAQDGTVQRAIELWLQPAATRDERVARVLRADRSTITLPEVRRAVGWRRTDLLDEVLTGPSHGRFLTRGVRHVPSFPAGCFDHWLPRQASAYAELLTDLATAPGVQVHERAYAVRMLGRVPGSAGALRGFLHDPQERVAEAALAALAWTDDPGSALGTLLSHAGTDRARVAVYAATRCARFVPPARLGQHLGPVLAGPKVTSRKEAARLLAELRAPDAGTLLAGAWAASEQHRDVRRALVSAARWFLDEEWAWALLAEATGREHAVATALLEVRPWSIAERHRTGWAGLVHAVAASTASDTARLGLTELARWSRWDRGGTDMLAGRVADLAGTATWRAALDALVAGCDATGDTAPLRAAAGDLLAAVDRFDAAPDRDLPARQRLAALAGAVRASANASPTLRVAAAELADTLTTVGTLRGLAVDLAVAAVGWDAPDTGLDRLRRVAGLADRPVLGWRAHHAVGRAAAAVVSRLPPDRLHATAEALAADGTPAAALLALALVTRAGAGAGWSEPWRALLRALRRHPDPDVCQAALDTVTSPE